MSKRAEALADKIGYATFDRDEVAALIDAELRKERERCAERAVKCIEKALYGKSTAWPCTAAMLRAAILSEGE